MGSVVCSLSTFCWVWVCTRLCRGVYIMCEEWTLCMYCTCQERTSDQEWTHLMSTVVVLTSVLDLSSLKISELTLKWSLKIFLRSFIHKQKSAFGQNLIVDHLNIDGPPFSVKCVRKFGFALSGVVKNMCVYACCMHKCMGMYVCMGMHMCAYC